ncbi:MAG: kelch repeat-containing protein [Thermoplasmata archaeon]|nr:kelch repeat-containing protein [Thermoplasmata archaeon]
MASNTSVKAPGVILFGGAGSSGTLNDTWAWNSTALTWSLFGSLRSSPEPRVNASMAYDAQASPAFLLLYGGGPTDTWKFNNNDTWTKLNPVGSPGVQGAGPMVFDPVDHYVVMFPSFGSQPPPYVHTTWEFSSNTWSSVAAPGCSPTCPQSVVATALTYDNGTGYVLLVGGDVAPRTAVSNVSAFTGGTWYTYSYANPITNPVPSQIRPIAGMGSRMTYDAALNRVVLVGGCILFCIPVGATTWEYFNGSWIAAPFIVKPPYGHAPCPAPLCFPEFDSAVAYDPTLGAVVVFGGLFQHPPAGGIGIMADTWELLSNQSYPAGVWALVNFSTHPPPRADAMMVFDAHDGYLLLFGGCADVPQPFGGCLQTRADTWRFSGTAWTQVSTGTHGPAGRAGAGMVYQPTLSEVLLLEGWNGTSGSALADEWSYSGGSWTSLGSSGITPARWDLAAAWDGYDSETVLFGGFGCSSTSVTYPCSDTWLGSGTMFHRDTGNGTGVVPPRGDAAIAYSSVLDPDGEVLILGGGLLGTTGESDTFQFVAASGWFAVSSWT